MKTFKTALVVFIAALLPLALFAAPSAAVLGDPDQGDIAGANLHQEKSASDHTKLSPPFTAGQQISLAANFTDGVRTVTIYRNTGSGWTSIASKQSASNGNAYFPYTVIEGNQKLFAEATGDLETEVDEIDVPVTPPPTPQAGVLNAPSTDGKSWTADFDPGAAGTVTKLQIQRIYTKETNEVNGDPAGSHRRSMDHDRHGQPGQCRARRLPDPVQPVPVPSRAQVPGHVGQRHQQQQPHGEVRPGPGCAEDHRAVCGVLQHQ